MTSKGKKTIKILPLLDVDDPKDDSKYVQVKLIKILENLVYINKCRKEKQELTLYKTQKGKF